LFNLTYSDDSREYSATNRHGSLYEDDKAFFERLAEMTRAMDVEPRNAEEARISRSR
jgi:hypothetical protein